MLAWRLDPLGRRPVPAPALRWVTAGAALAALSLVPAVRTVAPGAVIEDPALVLIFLSALIVASLWVTHLGQVWSSLIAESVDVAYVERSGRTPREEPS